jgi:hypothetical protein
MRRLRGVKRTSERVIVTHASALRVFVPSIIYLHGTKWVPTLKCALITEQFANLGLLRDHDQLLSRP